MLIGRHIRSRLDFLRPNTADKVEKQQSQQKKNHDKRAKLRKFDDGALVFVKNPLAGDKWFRGVVLSSQGNVSYSVRLESGRVRKCQIDQLRERPVELPSTPVGVPPVETPMTAPAVSESAETPSPVAPASTSESDETPSVGDNRDTMEPSKEVSVNPPLSMLKEYPKRNRSQVQRYDPSFK